MTARYDYRPSATWRSLMEGRAVLGKGLRRAIGNGRTTSIWTDPWIPADEPTIASRSNYTERGEETVRELLNEDATEWDTEELRARFDEATCIRIQSIPPNPCQGEDKWIWEYDRNRVYSVKTGYKSTMLEGWNQYDIGLNIDEGAVMRLWRRLWKMPIISRYKVFLWRACLSIIPTVESLERRGMIINEDCCMCNNAPEDVFHALVDCPNLQILWVMARFDYSSRVYHANILEWLAIESVEWSEEKLAALAVAMYHAWERRNKKKFAAEVIRAEDLWPRVERVMDELQIVTFSENVDRAEPTRFMWEKPEYPYMKLNVDATASKEGGGSMGGILRDATGDCVAVYMHSVPFPNDPILLEAVAIRKGLEMTQQKGCTHVIVESDAKLVIDMLRTPCDQASTLNALCRDILRLCNNFQVVNFNWVPRLSNLVADFISRKAKIERRNVVWTDSAPLFLSESDVKTHSSTLLYATLIKEGASIFESCENTNLENDWKPRIRMEFDSLEKAWKVGYSGRRHAAWRRIGLWRNKSTRCRRIWFHRAARKPLVWLPCVYNEHDIHVRDVDSGCGDFVPREERIGDAFSGAEAVRVGATDDWIAREDSGGVEEEGEERIAGIVGGDAEIGEDWTVVDRFCGWISIFDGGGAALWKIPDQACPLLEFAGNSPARARLDWLIF
ncbi:putative RNA-directed DNA polymerase [Senna tora]|uniref:Putative RNA-directed DNA polymerase n=1 Tax=Senna tora TaxID=362788 RepID=A0A834WMT2_9FABA|nr:putative RNA-directed DNA polymerase [Senna tora]